MAVLLGARSVCDVRVAPIVPSPSVSCVGSIAQRKSHVRRDARKLCSVGLELPQDLHSLPIGGQQPREIEMTGLLVSATMRLNSDFLPGESSGERQYVRRTPSD
jgi:hypothetical protein